jgi:pimeloyl-ACP methyl ester carboxylesterase
MGTARSSTRRFRIAGLANAPNAKVVSISAARRFVMLDQPVKFQQTLDDFLKTP